MREVAQASALFSWRSVARKVSLSPAQAPGDWLQGHGGLLALWKAGASSRTAKVPLTLVPPGGRGKSNRLSLVGEWWHGQYRRGFFG